MRTLLLLVCFSASTWAQAPYKPDAAGPRDAIPAEYKWQLGPLFADDAAFQKALTVVLADQQKLAACKGKLTTPAKVSECLVSYFDLRLRTNQLTLYANLRADTDAASSAMQAQKDRSLAAMNALMALGAGLRQDLLALDDGLLKTAYAADEKLRALKPFIDEQRRRKSRVLPPEAERVLSLAGDNLWAEIDLNELPSDHEKTHQALIADLRLPTITDEAGKPVELTLASYPKYRSSPKREVRKAAVAAVFSTLKAEKDALAATFAGQVNTNIFFARARGYGTALEAYLDKDNIDPAVYRNLIKTVRGKLKPLHDYVAMRKQAMGLKELHLYDLYPPIVDAVEMTYTYDDARRLLPEALGALGPEYQKILAEGLDPKNGWVDVYPHKNKESGAFCSSVFGTHPFLKLNYLEGYSDLSTLAHEFGHAAHSAMSNANQPYVTSNYVPFIAEIASTTNEKLLSDYMLAHAKTDAERLSLLNQLVESIRTTVYRQTLFAEFELRAHEAAESGKPLTADFLDSLYRELVTAYYGKDFTVDPDDDIEWAYVPHFFYKFYMMSYATGLSSGIAFSERIKKLGAPARDAYLTMLKSGSSKPPLVLLKDAGVDLSKPDAIVSALDVMQSAVAEMQKLLKKRSASPKP